MGPDWQTLLRKSPQFVGWDPSFDASVGSCLKGFGFLFKALPSCGVPPAHLWILGLFLPLCNLGGLCSLDSAWRFSWRICLPRGHAFLLSGLGVHSDGEKEEPSRACQDEAELLDMLLDSAKCCLGNTAPCASLG